MEREIPTCRFCYVGFWGLGLKFMQTPTEIHGVCLHAGLLDVESLKLNLRTGKEIVQA